ncbi:putative quinol monooxygenase [Massilia horti]|uniref:Antibiotic biosynthesis monooxygenase n=1 Tax=Massilia horti TaxID=2562153 RepID=A0A4Y9SQI0_9BURK|nr:hypothetical protein [Massilia horti]TFW28735.1 hypothetical protein E4O92_20560 [Massilia horti]
MLAKALLIHLDAKPGVEATVEELLLGSLPAARAETWTRAWSFLRFGRGEYAVFAAFADEQARQAHLQGPVALTLTARAGELLMKEPRFERIDILACKVPVVIPRRDDSKGLLLSFKARAGHESDVEQFLRGARLYVVEETGTTAWFAVRFEDGDYGIIDTFPDNGARFAHLTGHVPRELAKHALSLLGSMPDIHMLNVLAESFQT